MGLNRSPLLRLWIHSNDNIPPWHCRRPCSIISFRLPLPLLFLILAMLSMHLLSITHQRMMRHVEVSFLLLYVSFLLLYVFLLLLYVSFLLLSLFPIVVCLFPIVVCLFLIVVSLSQCCLFLTVVSFILLFSCSTYKSAS